MKANVHPDSLPKGGTASRDVLILGIGNILWADEGFGPRAAEAFHQRYETPAGVDVMDGGTLGGWLLDEILSTRRMLVFDCCDFKEKPGTLKVLKKSDVKIWSSTKISPHKTGFNDLLASAAHCVPDGPRPREPGRRGCSARKARRLRRKSFAAHSQPP